MQEKDLGVVSNLAMLANPHAVKAKYKRHILDELRKSPELSFAAEVDGKVVGYAQAEVNNGIALLEDIAVAAEFQKSGIGEKLLNEELRVLRQKKAKVVLAEVHYKCASAIPFYYKYGFRISGIAQDYFGVGHDAIILKLVL
jgi:ribosomal protein S18 acetylase RimI-like enzyme